MRSSLWVRLVGAFLLIIVVGSAATYTVINLVTASQFRRFVLAEDIAQAQALTAPLASFYQRQRNWQGVDSLLAASAASSARFSPGMQGMMDGMEGMMGRNNSEMIELMQASMGLPDRIVLLDQTGAVAADTAGLSNDVQIPAALLALGAPVLANGQQVGAILVGSMVEPTLNPLAEDFLHSMNLSLLIMSLLGGLLALGLGLLLFRQITAPLGKVTAAAEAVAAGDLSQRVTEEGAEELRRLAGSFNRMAAHLARSEELRRNMMADVAHELRTPLSIMQGNLEALMDGVFEVNEENLAAIHQETLLLNRLVGDLRYLAQAEAGELRLARAPCDVNRLARQVVNRLQVEAEEKGVTLVHRLAAGRPPVLADSQRIEQVFVNLISNGLRHTPEGGRVVVMTQENNGQVIVIVQDNGEGIAAEDLPNVFDRFYRADKSRSRGTGGSGLGLTIAQQIVKAHGGEIWVESHGPGLGSAFAFSLPVVQSKDSVEVV